MDLFDLYCKISIDPSGYEQGLESASAKMSGFGDKLKKLKKSVSDAAKTFATIGAGIGAAGTAVFAFANKVSTTADGIDKMSQKLGISAEGYQEWDFILTHCGASVDGLQASMKTLANAAADGTDSTKSAFEKLGLSMDEVAAMSQEDLFSAVITGLQNMEEGTERTAVAADLLGRSATELGPVFNMTAEETESLRQQVHDLGGVMSDEAVKNGAAFQDALTDLKTSFSGVTNGMAEGLIPTLTDLMNNVAAFIGNGGLQGLIDKFTELAPIITGATAAFVAYKAATAISGVIEALTKATEGQTIAQAALNAVMNANPFVLVATLIAAVGTALVTLYMTNDDFRNKVNAAWNSVKDTISGAVSAIRTFFTETIPNAAQKALDWFKAIPDKMKEIGINVINGFWNGIHEKAEWLKEKVTGFFSGIVDGVKGFLGIRSPSKLFREEIGQYIALGVAAGIEDKTDKAVKAADNLAKEVYSRSKDWADKNTKYMKLSLNEQIELWETIQSQFALDSQQYADAEEKIFDLRQKALEDYQSCVRQVKS